VYSGTTFTNLSGNLLGVHQKINRSAHRALAEISSVQNFPPVKQINHFEGKNGPDGIKSKSAGQDEPWHFYDPYDPEDTGLIDIINEHYGLLVEHLKKQNSEKAAFEAAWLSHALVDGLTPAHHYPYEEELERIRGAGRETRNTIKDKLVVKGSTKREVLKKNWLVWGAKGLITTHGLFEAGVATILAPVKIRNYVPSEIELAEAKKLGLAELFARAARQVAGEFAYDEFYRKGWTPSLASWIRSDLAPLITRVVAMAWYMALKEAGMANKPD
jgi:hypothetical protein